jgi:hypothetical protein
MPANESFYSFAAVLIPTLLFGGVLVDRLKPPKGASADSHGSLITAVVIGVAFAFYAEVLAINASLVGNPDKTDRVIVIAAVLIGTVIVALTVAWPWLELLGRRARWLLAIPLVILAVLSVPLLSQSIQRNSLREELARENQKITKITADTKEYEALSSHEEADEQAAQALALRFTKLLVSHPTPAKHSLAALELEQLKDESEAALRKVTADAQAIKLMMATQKLEEESGPE